MSYHYCEMSDRHRAYLETVIPPLDTVAKAATELDRRAPGWADGIDTSKLDMSDADRCILGYVYDHYFHAPWGLRNYRTKGGSKLSGHTMSSSLNDVFVQSRYEKEWLVEIEKRTSQPAPATPENDSLSDFKEQVRDMLIADLAVKNPRLLGAQLEALGLEPYEEPPPVTGTVVDLEDGDIAVYLPGFFDDHPWVILDAELAEWESDEWVRANRS